MSPFPADGDDGRADSFILMWRVGTLENPDPDDLPEGAESVVIPVRDKQAGDEITYVLTDIAEQTRYTVAIVAVDPWGNRSETTVISFGTPANTPPALILESTEEVRVGYNRHRNGAVPCFGSRQPRFHLRVAGSFRAPLRSARRATASVSTSSITNAPRGTIRRMFR